MIINVNSNGSNLMPINEIKVYDGSMRTKVKTCRKYTIGIDITDGRMSTMNDNPYFKIYSGTYSKSNDSARIDMRTGEQIFHKDGKNPLRITKDILNWLDEVLTINVQIMNILIILYMKLYGHLHLLEDIILAQWFLIHQKMNL